MDGDCVHFEALMAGLFDGRLAREDRAALDRHVASCGACRLVIETLAPAAETLADHTTLEAVDPAGYELGLEIARGGMGRIVAARDLRVGRPVAIKELLARTPELATRFEREARVTARLQHPGIVPIYEIGRWPDGTPFYAMRMVDGGTLRQAIAAAPTLAARLALLPAVIAASEAVAFAHAQRIIHRDLTPSNVLVGPFGETVVIDWGLAKDLALDDEPVSVDASPAPAAASLTKTGAIVGTAAYMPPEQARGEHVDERADVYALGAMLYHVLAGAPPYRARDGVDPVKAGPPAPIAELAAGAPRDLLSIVAKAMSRDPAARYPTAFELVAELKRFSAGRMVEAHAYTRVERLRRFAARHRAALIATAVAGGIVLAGGAIGLKRVLDSRREANATVTRLLEEKGRTELLAGRPIPAFAFLADAFQRGDRSAAIAFLLESALRDIEDVGAPLDCGTDVRFGDLVPGDTSPDGQYLAAPCGDVGKIWRLSDRALVHTLGPTPHGFDEVRFSHDGATLVALGLDGVARLYDAHTGELRHELVHHPGTRITAVGFTPDDRRLVTSGFDGKAVVWDAVHGTREREIVAGGLGFLGVHSRLVPGTRILLTATLGGAGDGWDIDTGERLGTIDHGSLVLGGDASLDGTMASTCGADHRARVWDLATHRERFVASGHTDVVWKCVFSPDSRRLLTTSSDGTAKVWDIASGALLTSTVPGGLVWSAAFSPDGQLFTTSSLGGASDVWSTDGGSLLASYDAAGKAAQFSRDSRLLITQRADGKIVLRARPAGRLAHQLVPPAGSEVRAVSPDGTRAVVARGFALELWDTAARAPVAARVAEPFAFSPDGRRLATRDAAGIVVLDARDGTRIAELPIDDVASLALVRDGRWLVVGGRHAAPRVWDLDTHAAIAAWDSATQALLDDRGRLALTWSAGAAARVWELGEGEPRALGELAGTERGFRPLGFTADGARIALHVDGDDGHDLLRVWDTRTRTPVFAIDELDDSARFDPGKTLLTAIVGGEVVSVYDARDGRPRASFVGEQLSSAQVDATGTLVVALDRLGDAVLVLDASAGRTLARWSIVHPPLETSENTVELRGGGAWWTPDGRGLVAHARDITVWSADRFDADPVRVERAQRQVPWHVVDGRLEWARVAVEGVVAYGDRPAAGARVVMRIREVPRNASSVSWSTQMSRERELAVTTDDDGRFVLPDVLPGEYTLVARRGQLASEVVAGSTRDPPVTLVLR